MLPNILIVGVGLIGGSIGLALKGSPLVNKIAGADKDMETLQKALELGAIDYYTTLKAGARQADIVILCTPVNTFTDIIDEIKEILKPGTILTDAASTKHQVLNIFTRLPEQIYTIGGHPMAGGEALGIINADKYLFENAVYVLTPVADTPPEVTAKLTDILSFMGARIMIMEAGYHDEIVAAISHIPHIAASALVNLTHGDSDKLAMAAGGFRDTTRIASSDPELWQQILFSNREPIIEGLNGFIESLSSLRDMLASNNYDELYNKLKRAQEIRNAIPHMRKGLMPGFSDVICIVPDQPGIIGELGNILGNKMINIVDLEILHVREGDGGTVRIGVPSFDKACQAVEALKENGIKAWVR
ncbi:MAG TPA: prephenate dehydrogenase [Syntrophomonadaceae bacterium]|nr:prephenate dehydrogenase [Syntrophomonadaceae bacterium]HNX28618.1 prephenate dehydrogenase [Syntrophomonadaceae bacterium]HPR94016.1 prephenate dehydrogenase [Syntrophomonadaceae bacterium]